MKKAPIYCLVAASVVLSGCNTTVQARKKSEPALTPITKANAKSLTDEQILKLEAMVQKSPKDANVLVQLGQCYGQKGRESGELGWYVKSRETLENATELDSKNSAAWQSLGHTMTIFHRFGKAIEFSEKALTLNKNDFRAHGVISDAYLELGDYDKALESAQRMIDLKPDLASYSRGAKLRAIFGDSKGSALLYTQAIAAGSPYAENTAWARTMLGELYFENGALVAAEQQFEAALKTVPEYRHAQMGLGRVRWAQDKPDAALELMAQACRGTAPVRYLADLALLHRSLGNTEEVANVEASMQATMDAYESHGIEPDLIHYATYLLESGKDVGKAYQILEHEVDHHKTVEAHAAFALACHETGRTTEATKHIELAMRTNKQDALLWYRASIIHTAAGDLSKGQKLGVAAKSLSPYLLNMHDSKTTVAKK